MTLREEILEQPEVLARLLEQAGPAIYGLRDVVRAAMPEHVIIAARGTSDHAAIYAQYALGVRAGLSVGLATPSVLSLYGAVPRMAHALVIGISQSGASPDVVGVIRAAREQGAPTLAITNTEGSPLAMAAEHVIALTAGPERAVAATKTYTATVLAIAMLATALAPTDEATAELNALPGLVAAALTAEDEVRRIAADQAALDRCVVLGRGYHYATAREWGLKLKELAYVLADPYSAADFMHGPLALIEAGFPTLAVVPSGAALADVLGILDRVKTDLDARLMVLSDDPGALGRGHWSVPLPGGVPEWLMPIVAIVPGQLHAMHLTMAKGRDPELPRSIGKVTLTR